MQNPEEERGERGGGGGGMGEISLCRQPGRQDIAQYAAEETNNASFINSRLKAKQREAEKEDS